MTIRRTAALAAAACLLFAAAPRAPAQRIPTITIDRDTSVITHATGTFEVKIQPLTTDVAGLARFALDKTYSGDLQGTSKGEMLANGGAEGFGVYTAIEVVTATLAGKSGTFALHHYGVMDGGAPTLEGRIVPGSGTGALTGISGTFTILLEGGKHGYALDYTLPGS